MISTFNKSAILLIAVPQLFEEDEERQVEIVLFFMTRVPGNLKKSEVTQNSRSFRRLLKRGNKY